MIKESVYSHGPHQWIKYHRHHIMYPQVVRVGVQGWACNNRTTNWERQGHPLGLDPSPMILVCWRWIHQWSYSSCIGSICFLELFVVILIAAKTWGRTQTRVMRSWWRIWRVRTSFLQIKNMGIWLFYVLYSQSGPGCVHMSPYNIFHKLEAPQIALKQ